MAEFEAGDRMGPYLLLFRLGKGGMGEVWAAVPWDRPVDPDGLLAVKVMKDADPGSNHAAMFRDEAKVARAMAHAGIVRTVDCGLDQGRLYLAMDLVRGPSLTALLQRMVVEGGHMPPEVVCAIGLQVALALAYAHEEATVDGRPLHLIHRDVSPHNILLDLEGRVLLTDFGIARSAVQEHLSRVGTVRGKPSYMAPEQVTGGALDGRTDLFALGIVMHECSALRRLFGRSEPSRSIDAVLHHDAPDLGHAVEGFPPSLARVIGACLEKKPSRRPATGRHLVSMLKTAQRELPPYRPSSLRDLLLDHFEPSDFDPAPRVAEGLAAARAKGTLTEATQAQTQLLTRHERSGPAAQPPSWPTTSAREPLDPDELEKVRTQLVARGRIEPTRVAAMGGDATSAVVVHQAPAGPGRLQLLAAFLATVAVGTVVLLAAGLPETGPTAPKKSASPPVQVQPAVRPGAQTAPPGPQASPEPDPASSAESAPVLPPDPQPSRPRRARPVRRRTEPATVDPPSKPTPPPVTEADVTRALRRLKAVDPGRAAELMAEFTEYRAAVGEDPEFYRTILAKIRKALAE